MTLDNLPHFELYAKKFDFSVNAHQSFHAHIQTQDRVWHIWKFDKHEWLACSLLFVKFQVGTRFQLVKYDTGISGLEADRVTS